MDERIFHGKRIPRLCNWDLTVCSMNDYSMSIRINSVLFAVWKMFPKMCPTHKSCGWHKHTINATSSSGGGPAAHTAFAIPVQSTTLVVGRMDIHRIHKGSYHQCSVISSMICPWHSHFLFVGVHHRQTKRNDSGQPSLQMEEDAIAIMETPIMLRRCQTMLISLIIMKIAQTSLRGMQMRGWGRLPASYMGVLPVVETKCPEAA